MTCTRIVSEINIMDSFINYASQTSKSDWRAWLYILNNTNQHIFSRKQERKICGWQSICNLEKIIKCQDQSQFCWLYFCAGFSVLLQHFKPITLGNAFPLDSHKKMVIWTIAFYKKFLVRIEKESSQSRAFLSYLARVNFSVKINGIFTEMTKRSSDMSVLSH